MKALVKLVAATGQLVDVEVDVQHRAAEPAVKDLGRPAAYSLNPLDTGHASTNDQRLNFTVVAWLGNHTRTASWRLQCMISERFKSNKH